MLDTPNFSRADGAGNVSPAALVAQLDRASDYGSEGWGFESLRARFTDSLSKPQQRIDPLGLDPLDRGYSTDGFVEGSDLAYPGGFRASHKVGVGKIKPFAFIQGNRSQQ